MTDLLLTHGYFLAEDEKERQIMKPYPPLGLLYLSAFLKTRGYSVEIFDSTFAERSRLVERFASESGTVGIYTTLMTRRSVLEIVRAAKRHGWRVILGGPESANYTAEYLEAGADAIVIGEGELTLSELLPALARAGRTSLARRARHRVSRRGRRRRAHARARQAQGSRLAAVAGPRGHRPPLVSRRVENAPRREQHQSDHGSRLPLSLQLVLARRVRLYASPPQSRRRRRRDAGDRRSLRSRSGLVRRRRLHDQPSLARRVRGRARAPRHPSAVRDDHARGSAAKRDGRRAAAQARLLSNLDRLGERQPEDPRRDGARRDRRAGAPFHEARASARHSGRHVLDVGLRGRGARGHRRDGRARQAQQPRRVLDDGLLSDQGHGLLREGARQGRAAAAVGRRRPTATTSSKAGAARSTTSSRIGGCATRSRRRASKRETPRAPPSS